jgi:lysophospholipase L1-like esterase
MNFKKLILSGLLVTTALCSFESLQKKNVDIVFIGDSITHGAKLKDYTTQAPPVFATAYLQQAFGFGNIQFSNQGVSGYTTVDFLPSNKTYKKVIAAADMMYNDKSATLVFCIMLGTNDSAISGPNGAPVAANQYRGNLKTISDSLLGRYPDCKIIINHPIWYSPNCANGHSTYLQEGLTRLQTYFAEIQTLVKDYKSSHPKHVFLGDEKAFSYFKKNFMTDLTEEKGPNGTFYLHPNEKGAKALGQLWGKAIEKNLK